ncbi:MAG: hypothetical protein NVS4B1_23460 [Ktedonobacteraceae bacterium]
MLWTQRRVHVSSLARIKVATLLFVVVLLAGCGGGDTTTPKPTPTPLSVQFSILDLHLPQKAYTAAITGAVADRQILHVSVSFKLNQAVLDKLKHIKKGDTKGAQDLQSQLGISDQEYQQIKAFFGVENATLNLGKLHTYLTIDAKAGSFAHLLQTKFVMHILDGRSYYTPDASMPPKLPTQIANQILAVSGLDSYTPPIKIKSARPSISAISVHTTRNVSNTCVPDQGYTTQQIAHAYGYDSLWQAGFHGENMTVYLVEIDGIPGGAANPDLQTFFNCVGYKGTFSLVNTGAPAPPAQSGQPSEALLDADMIAGMAPGVNIVDYEVPTASFQAINDALQQIVNVAASNPNTDGVVSISLGASEANLNQTIFNAMDSTIQQLLVKNITTFASSGDCGAFDAGDNNYGSLSVNFPASDPSVVAVGGTKLRVDANGNRLSEAVWTDGGQDHTTCNNNWGSGGGVSIVFKRPSWQQGPGIDNQYTTGNRQVPDIAAVATDINEYNQGQWYPTGGTSAATPIWAAGFVLANQVVLQKTANGGNQGTFFYAPDTFYTAWTKAGSLQPFYNVTQGNNLYYPASSGWNYPTGIGTPNLVDFTNDLYNMSQTQ